MSEVSPSLRFRARFPEVQNEYSVIPNTIRYLFEGTTKLPYRQGCLAYRISDVPLIASEITPVIKRDYWQPPEFPPFPSGYTIASLAYRCRGQERTASNLLSNMLWYTSPDQ